MCLSITQAHCLDKAFGARWLLSAQREQHLQPAGGTGCSYHNTDRLSGVLAPLVFLCFGGYMRRGHLSRRRISPCDEPLNTQAPGQPAHSLQSRLRQDVRDRASVSTDARPDAFPGGSRRELRWLFPRKSVLPAWYSDEHQGTPVQADAPAPETRSGANARMS